MENSELQTQVINLGKLFIKELGLEQSVDTFSRWMAHYIAEKMKVAENLPVGKEKDDAEKECFKTILKLWEHRWLLPNGRRPLENFEPIFKIIQRLDPENNEPFFHRISEHELLEIETTNPMYSEIKDYLELSLQIDKIAKVWIEYTLQQAANKANDEKTQEWLKNVICLPNNNDIMTIRLLTKDLEESEESSSGRKSKIRKNIEVLKRFSKLNEFLLDSYEKELQF